MHRIPITIRLESFEGPLDLLLYLIQSHELNISKVSLSRITDQYLNYVRLMQELNFDLASEFLVMASTLLLWKSRALLPQIEKEGTNSIEEEGELTQEELIRQLLEHKRFLEAGRTLAEVPMLGEEVFSRANSKPPVEKVWKTLDLNDLTLCFQDLLVKARKRKKVLRKETVSITQTILGFADRIKLRTLTAFRKLFVSLAPSKAEWVAGFLGILELARLKKMKLHQEAAYQEIYVELLEPISTADVASVEEFSKPEPKPEDESPSAEPPTTLEPALEGSLG